jgi:2,4-dienoyl-CoA reductase-like NADH-dependent reductase (Old Yellow Enzyme family)
MTNQQSNLDGSLHDDELRWLARRADGGFGVIETCAAHVTRDGQSWEGQLGTFSDELLPGLTRLASTLREKKSFSLVQLFHGGVRSPSSITGGQPISASAFTEERPGFETPRAASEEDIARLIGAFRDAAVRCHRAGFDGVELHGAHGYLLGQFLSKTMNTRADGWGGTFENRARFLRETLRAVRGAVPASFTVGVRISPEDLGQARGLDLDENLQLTRWLAQDGIDFLHISLWEVANKTQKYPEKHPVPLFREALPASIPLVSCGNIWTGAEAEGQLALGADAVALGRSGIGNPDWSRLVLQEGQAPARPPFTRAELEARSLSPKFAGYMARWKGFVKED